MITWREEIGCSRIMMDDGGVEMMRGVVQILGQPILGRAMSANINNYISSFSVLQMMMGDWREALALALGDTAPISG